MKFFSTIGRFSVHFRWLVILIWVVGAIAAAHLFPSLSSVTQSNNSSFLPSSAPTEKALNLSSAFGKTNLTPVMVVIARDNGALTRSDQLAIGQLQTALSGVPGTYKVDNIGRSADGQAEELEVLANKLSDVSGNQITQYVKSIRSTIDSTTLPSDLQVHLAGTIATEVDNSKQSGLQNSQLQIGAAIFIIVLLLLIFKAPLAPIITLVPPLVVITAAGPLIAEAAQHGLKVSVLVQLLLTVLVLGAGTDYGLFLIFRVREELQNGSPNHEAIVRAMAKVGEAISFSAATVVAALLSLLVATFQLYSNLGVPLAIGIGLMLLAGLTLLPALLAVFGRAAFWPSLNLSKNRKSGLWGRISARVVQYPMAVLGFGIIFFGILALLAPGYQPSGFGGAVNAPAGSDAAKGNALLTKHFPSSSVTPTSVLFVLPRSVWQDPTPLVSAQLELSNSKLLKGVIGALNPNGATLSTAQLLALHSVLGAPQQLPPIEPSRYLSTIDQLTYAKFRSTANYIAPSGLTVQYLVNFSVGSQTSTAAMNAVPAVRQEVSRIAQSIGATHSGVAGEAAAYYDISSISNSDLIRVIPIAIIVIGILLAILMRSLVAPLYLVASVGLSYLAALGMTVLLFMHIGGSSGLTFILPFLMFLFLLALGEDYNILVMSRIREEAHNLTLKEAVSRALTTTGTTVTSAGLVLAGTFAVLAVVAGGSSSEIRDIGYGLAIGVLMDTFLVRTLIVPSVVVLLGRWNWWPSRLYRQASSKTK